MGEIPESERINFWMPFEGIAKVSVKRLKDQEIVEQLKLHTDCGQNHIDINISGYEPGTYSCTLEAEGFQLLVGDVQEVKKFLKVFTVK